MCFDQMCVSCCTMCVVYSKIKFIANTTNVTEIHIFYFYNNRHTYIIKDTTLLQNTHILSKPT